MPHVTFGTTTLPSDAIKMLAGLWSRPVTGWLDSLDLMRFDPVEVLFSHPQRG